VTDSAANSKFRPFFALWQFTKAALWAVVAFWCFKYAYFLFTENPKDLGLKAAAEKTEALARSLEKFDKRTNNR